MEKISTKLLQKIIREELAIQQIAADAVDTPEVVSVEGEKSETYGDGGSARMARSQLFRIAKFAQSLHDTLADGDKLPEWVQSKIASVVDDMDEIHGHLDHKIATHDKKDEPAEAAKDVAPLLDLIANLHDG